MFRKKKKIPVGRIIPPFFCRSSESEPFFSFTHMIRTRFFGPGELNQNGLGTAQYIQARSSMARNLENNGKERQAEGEAKKWSNEKLHLENARKLRGIYFIDPEDKEFKETMKNARKKLETSVAPALPCKIMKKMWE